MTSANTIAGNNFTGLGNGQTVEFRLYFADSVSGSDRIHRLDNIVLGGTVVPEASSYALLAGLTGLTWVALRRCSS